MLYSILVAYFHLKPNLFQFSHCFFIFLIYSTSFNFILLLQGLLSKVAQKLTKQVNDKHNYYDTTKHNEMLRLQMRIKYVTKSVNNCTKNRLLTKNIF